MIAVIQRVSESSVKIDGKIKAEIGLGLMVLLGIEEADGPERGTDPGEGAGRTGPGLGELDAERHRPHQDTLQGEDRDEAHDREASAPVTAHRDVSVVLAVTDVAPGEVHREP